MQIEQAVIELLKIVDSLHERYPQKEFTLDGRLVGDLGEILAEKDYEIELYPSLMKYHDGRTPDGREVQIKTTMKKSLTFPVDHIPQYYLGIKIHSDGSYTEIYNGPGKPVHDLIKDRAVTKNNLHSISVARLAEINPTEPSLRIPKRK